MSTAISNAFRVFLEQAPEHAAGWGQAINSLAQASALDEKTSALAYLAVLAALGMHTGIPFHVQEARKVGASREEIISAVLLGLPAAGNGVIQALPAALAAYDDA